MLNASFYNANRDKDASPIKPNTFLGLVDKDTQVLRNTQEYYSKPKEDRIPEPLDQQEIIDMLH